MKIAVDFREASKETKTGKGWYAYNLMQAVLEQDSANEYIFYIDSAATPPEEFKKFRNIAWRRIIRGSIFWHLAVLADLKKSPPDMFFATTSFIIPSLAPKNLKTIIIVHDLIAFLFPSHNKKAVFIEKLTLKPALKKAAAIITISENTKTDLIHKFNPSQEKIAIIHAAASDKFHPMSSQEIKTFRSANNLPDRFILAVGTLEPRKNFIKLIEAFDISQKDFPDLRLVIIGSKGWQYKEIFKKIRALKLEDRIIFKGYASEENLVKYYNSAEIFIFPSLYEGFGIPPLEAMKCGCPVVCSNTSSMPEVVGSAVIQINPQNEKDIAQAIKSILTSPAKRDELIKKGIIQSQKFSWASGARKLISLINSF